MTAAPWDDPIIVDAAVDAACRVRDDNPDDLRAELARIPHDAMSELVLVLAAMVDVDEPLSTLTRWEAPGFLRPVPDEPAEPDVVTSCRRGHPLTNGNRYGNGVAPDGSVRWRCRTCLTAQRARKATA